MEERTTFEPGKYLTKVNGRDYLEVKWRLVWFRNEHPDGEITTELVEHADRTAVFRARVSVPGGGTATGWGTESAEDFGDYVEKAETKAVGRALAALGYGTQFCPDFDFGAAANRIVDAPIDISTTRGRRTEDGTRATPRQINYVRAIAHEVGLTDEELNEEVTERFGTTVEELGRRDASVLIEQLQQRRDAAHIAS